MAIVSMKRVSLLGMASARDKLLDAMQRFGCVQITAVDGDVQAYKPKGNAQLEADQAQLTRIRWAISHLNRYDTTKVRFIDSFAMPEASREEAEQAEAHAAQLMAVVEAAEACERRSGELRGQETRIRAQIDQLLPWKKLDVPVEKIADSRDTLQFIGTVNNRQLQGLQAALDELPVVLELVGEERESVFIWLAAHKSAKRQVLEALKDAEYSAVSFAGDKGTIAQLLDALHAEQSALQAERDKLEEEMKQLAKDMPGLKLLHEIVSARVARETAADDFAVTETTFLMEGWVPESAAEKLEAKLHKVAQDVVVSFRDPTDEEKPPTMLHNNRVAAPFETIVTSYSYPDPRGIDPTVVMAPFFACLFGMMLSDAGYGLLMAIAIPLIIHFMRPKPGMRKLMWVMFFGGIFTVIWGTVFNTWFGFNPSFMPMIIDTLNDPIPMLAVCIGIGALHLFTGLGVAAYMNIKRKKYMDVVYDQLSWFAIVLGVPLMLLPQTAAVGKWMLIGGAAVVLLFAGRDKPKLISRLISGGGALYNISSWLSDLLSYMRLFGMGLATGVIGMVINMLVQLIMGNGIIGIILGVALFAGGHAFNFAINALGAYVHSCRLQYIEFFSKFYEDGGEPFKPLAQTPLYFAIADNGMDGVEQ